MLEDYNENYITGWIKVFRSLSGKGWYRKSEHVHLWIHILIKATHKGMEVIFDGKNVKLNAGQFITGRKSLSKETGINESKVERLLTFFEKKEAQIEQQKCNKNRLITVLNWGVYQVSEQQVNNKRTTSEQQVNTNKNIKKEKNENIEVLFESFWNQYHLKTKLLKSDKIPTEKYWKSLSEKEKQKAIDNIQNYYDSIKDKKFLKKARTYLSAKSFNDEFKKVEKEEHPIGAYPDYEKYDNQNKE